MRAALYLIATVAVLALTRPAFPQQYYDSLRLQPGETIDEFLQRMTRLQNESLARLRDQRNQVYNLTDQTNSSTANLSQQRLKIESQTEFINRLIDNPKQPEFEAQAPQWRRKWDEKYGDLDKQVEEWRKQYGADAGPRIRIVNPYTESEYTRYYDDKTQSLQITKVKDSYELLQQSRRDWEQSYKRARDSRDQVAREYQRLVEQYGEIQARSSAVAGALAAERQRLERLGGERPPQRPAAPGEEVRDGIRYRNGYPVSPDHLKIPGYRGPRWVNGRLVSP